MKQGKTLNGCMIGCLTVLVVTVVLGALAIRKILIFLTENEIVFISSGSENSLSEEVQELIQNKTGSDSTETTGKLGHKPNPVIEDMMVQMLYDGEWDLEFDVRDYDFGIGNHDFRLRNYDSDYKYIEKLKPVITDTYDYVMDTYREFFFIDCFILSGPEVGPTATEDGRYRLSMHFSSSKTYEDEGVKVQDILPALEHAADTIIAQIPPNSSDYERALFVHDYLVANTEYDQSPLPSPDPDEVFRTELRYTAYGALVQHKAVCAGYASAYQYVLQRLHVPCEYYSGDSVKLQNDNPESSSNGHAWNSVELNGKSYWVDVTWDDPIAADGKDVGGPVRHKYCFIDTETLLKDHKFDSDLTDLPSCTDKTLNEQLLQQDVEKGIIY